MNPESLCVNPESLRGPGFAPKPEIIPFSTNPNRDFLWDFFVGFLLGFFVGFLLGFFVGLFAGFKTAKWDYLWDFIKLTQISKIVIRHRGVLQKR